MCHVNLAEKIAPGLPEYHRVDSKYELGQLETTEPTCHVELRRRINFIKRAIMICSMLLNKRDALLTYMLIEHNEILLQN